MKKTNLHIIGILCFLLFLFTGSSLHAQGCYFVNYGNTVVVVSGNEHLVVKGSIIDSTNARFDNSGKIDLTGDWTNSSGTTGFINSSPGKLNMQGAVQNIRGKNVTKFYDLILNGTGVKKLLNVSAIVQDSLILNNHELAADTNTVFETNTATGIITRSSGFVSSLSNGGLSRQMNQTSVYSFAVGSSTPVLRYRPVDVVPTSTSANTFKVRMANVDASTETFNRSTKDTTLCEINPKFYHRIFHTAGTDSAALTFYYDTLADGAFSTLAHWQTVPEWVHMNPVTAAYAVSPAFSTLAKTVWSNYIYSPFALAIPAVMASAGSNLSICAGTASVSLTGTATNASSVSWSTSGTGTFSNLNSLTTNYLPSNADTAAGSVVLSLHATGKAPCSSYTSNITLTIHPLPGITLNPIVPAYCSGGSVVITAGGASTYSWSPGGGLNVTTGNTVTANPVSSSTYTLTGTSAFGCVNTLAVPVTVNPSPTPSISGTNTICTGGNTTLTASGGGTYSWNTGPVSSSITVSPVVNTTYTVTVTNGAGCSATATQAVTVNPNLVPVISGADSICTGNSTTLTASGGSSYSWNTGSTSATVSVNPVANTTYTVTASNGAGCTGSATQTITVSSNPVPAITGANAICNGNSTTLTASGGGTYSWNTGSVASSLTVNPVVNTAYTVVVTNALGCTASATQTVTVNAIPTPAITGTTTICAGSAATLAASGGGTYSWDTGPVSSAITVNPLSNTTYTVTVTSGAGCTAVATQAITVNPLPAITTLVQNASCGSSNGTVTATVSNGSAPYTYSWDNGQASQTDTALSAGTYTVTVTNVNGCSQNATAVISSTQPSVLLSGQNNVSCHGGTNGSATVTASGGVTPYTYSWSTVPAQTTANASGLPAGTYTVTLQDSSGCVKTQTVTITQPAILNDTLVTSPVCGAANGSSVATVTGGTGPYTYSWSPSGGNNAMASGLSSGTYTCFVTDSKGCIKINSVGIVSHPAPVAGVSPDITIQWGSTTLLSASGGNAYSWSPAVNLSCTSCQSPAANPATTTTYFVTVKDTTTGCTSIDSVTVTVDIICGEVFVPNGFSPNGDGVNDVECVYGKCIETMHFSIYDRWGEKVFETENTGQCWDGTYKGQLMNSAVFVYYLQATMLSGESISKKGNISLIR